MTTPTTAPVTPDEAAAALLAMGPQLEWQRDMDGWIWADGQGQVQYCVFATYDSSGYEVRCYGDTGSSYGGEYETEAQAKAVCEHHNSIGAWSDASNTDG